MAILQDVSEITGHDETEYFILLCMQSCRTEFTLTDKDAAKDDVIIAYTAQAEDEVGKHGKTDKSKLPEQRHD